MLLLALLLTAGWLSPLASPVAALNETPLNVVPAKVLPRLPDFIGSVQNGAPDMLVGVYSPGILAAPIEQQPASNPAFVSSKPGVLTQFRMAQDYGSTGLLAHNTMAGSDFFSLSVGREIVLVYGDGATRRYRISGTGSYQALSPRSPYSNFIDLESGDRLTAADLFLKVYAAEDRLVFQTCIEAYGDVSWGRLFVIAEPVPEVKTVSFTYLPFAIWIAVPQ